MLTILLAAALAGDPQLQAPIAAAPPSPTPSSSAPVLSLGEAATQAGSQQSGTDRDAGRVRFVWRSHPSLRFGSKLRIDFLGKFQWDARHPGDEPADFDTTELHRARVGIEGEAFRHIQFNVERELTERELDTTRSKSPWKDAYVEANYTDAAQVRFGKFKVPFGLDQLTSVASLDFVYRSLAGSYLAPGRDIGAMVHGRFFGRTLNYSVGVFSHDGDNARSQKIQGGDETGAARVVVRPFRPIKTANLDALEVGSAYTVSALSDASVLPNGLRARTTMSQFVFFEPVFVKGRRQRFEVDLDWSVGPFGLRSEYTDVRDDRLHQGLGDNTLPDARARSWYVSGAFVVTGEAKDRPVAPRAELGRGGFGALEVVARFERLRFDSVGGEDLPFRNPRAETILPSADRVLSVGLNWYTNRWVKLQLQAVREHLDDPPRSPLPDGSAFWSPVFRVQLGI